MTKYLDKTFLLRGNGFQFARDPPPDIHQRRYLRSRDRHEVVACILANLQSGAFDVIGQLGALVSSTTEPPVWNAATMLFGYAAPMPTLRQFVLDHGGTGGDFVRHDVLDAAASAGALWIVPQLLSAHAQFTNHDARRYCQESLSWLLEDADGPIADGPEELEPADADPPPIGELEPTVDFESYRALVQARLDELTSTAALTDEAFVIEGEKMNLEHVVKRLLARVKAGVPGSRIENGRMLFEATTGIDCRGFYNSNGVLQPLSAAAILEDFLLSGHAAKYPCGVRCFFGHVVPK